MTEFEFDSTPETDAMLKQLCIKECFVRCKDCKYWYNDEYETEGYCDLTKYFHMTADDFCSRGERR